MARMMIYLPGRPDPIDVADAVHAVYAVPLEQIGTGVGAILVQVDGSVG